MVDTGKEAKEAVVEPKQPRLYEVLNNRIAINMLKLLYEQELADKKVYAAKLSELQGLLVLVEKPQEAVDLLQKGELVTTDVITGIKTEMMGEETKETPYEETLVSITSKGKEFIETFDQLIEVYTGETVRKRKSNVKIGYDLTTQEKRLLLATHNLAKENKKKFVPLKKVVQTLFPKQPYKKKATTTNRAVTKLEQLNLMHKKKQKKVMVVKVTDKGFLAIKDVYEKGLEI